MSSPVTRETASVSCVSKRAAALPGAGRSAGPSSADGDDEGDRRHPASSNEALTREFDNRW
jgi:hypothetical protein